MVEAILGKSMQRVKRMPGETGRHSYTMANAGTLGSDRIADAAKRITQMNLADIAARVKKIGAVLREMTEAAVGRQLVTAVHNELTGRSSMRRSGPAPSAPAP
jgi:hypothetical protein